MGKQDRQEIIFHLRERSLKRAKILDSLLQDIDEDVKIYDFLIEQDNNPRTLKLIMKTIAIADGYPINSNKLKIIKNNKFKDFDVVLNIPEGKLLSRHDPDKHTPLQECSLQGIANHRIRLLKYMLEHLYARICVENIHIVYKTDYLMTDEALKKAISIYRQVLQPERFPNSYILTKSAWGESSKKRGCVYTMNKKCRYLVIWKNV